ncbi:DUF1737 domain-containing protein, partial [Salmonella enterica]|nr:DUF1737 domain-containing protein [Salmonella enterica]
MNFTQYDLVTASTHDELRVKLTKKITQGWQPHGAPVTATAPGAPFYLMQAIVTVAAGAVTTAPHGAASPQTPTSPAEPATPGEPEYYYVIPVAGQSNMMAYGEGVPLPDTL